MAEPSPPPTSQYFNLTFPLPYVAHVEINRPEKLNAFIEPMWLALPPIFSYLSSSPSVRAIILSGAGAKAFTAGLDIVVASTSGPLVQGAPPQPQSTSPTEDQKESDRSRYSQPTGTPYTTQKPPPPPPTAPLDPARLARSMLNHITTFQSCVSSLEKCSKPIVAVLHGYCYGLGVDISLCADVRICTPDAKFAVKEVDTGLAADIGTLSRLGKSVASASWVKDVCLTGREFDAYEALRMGFVSGVAEQGGGKEGCMAEALRWAGLVAEKSPVAVQGTKELLNWSRDRSVDDGLRYTAVWNSVALQTNDTGAAMRAQQMRRKARFEKL
ncbi:MAG: hypothetical protein LQ338_004174 [Usnochroma carphineum]|nr:MAG: hypothetical protein LQ338_004174 [Usnochroma carphineum]